MQSTWKTPQLGRKPRGSSKPRPRGHQQSTTQPRTLPPAGAASAASSPSATKSLWSSLSEEKQSFVGRKGERSRSSSKVLHHHHLHHHQTRSSDLHKDPSPQPPISKMDSCHISDVCSRWDAVHAGNGVASGASAGFSAGSSPPRASGPGATVPNVLHCGPPRLRLSRQVKSRGRGFSGGGSLSGLESNLMGKDTSLLDAAETDGYFSDGEQSDTDTHSGGRKLRLTQLHSGNEDLLRRSVLAS